MRLKLLREKAGLSQRAFASIMGVSQPTVTRWESGKAEMSGQRLQEAARLLNCTPDDLLGVRKAAPTYFTPPPEWDADQACWGTLRFIHAEKVHDFPISFSERSRIAEAALDFEQESSWLKVSTLNNALLLLNLEQLDGFDLITDDEEEAPFHMDARAYAALMGGGECIEDEEEAMSLEGDIESFRKLHSADQEQAILHTAQLHYAAGRVVELPFDSDAAEAISLLLFDPSQPKFFEVPNMNGYLAHVVSLKRIAFIQVPLAALSALGEEADDE